MNPGQTTARRTRIKFCGITRAEDAARATELGVDALGFVLVPRSPRFIAPAAAAIIRRALPPFVSAVALFQDANAEEVQAAVNPLRPDLLQFHGSETAAFCESFGLPYMKAVAMAEPQDLEQAAREFDSSSALLLDSHGQGGMGGRGETFDWTKVVRSGKPLVLAGGLNAQNVGEGIHSLRPYAVDVSSGIESRPGIKNFEKMRAFVDAVRRADLELSS
ncbi:MAG: phosphoribosylanthranilate isomerase [Stenotrophobium sp.]